MTHDPYANYEHPPTPADERRIEAKWKELREEAEKLGLLTGTSKRHYGIECRKAHCTCVQPDQWITT